MALMVRFQPWVATGLLIGIGLGWRALVAFDGDGLRDFYFGDTPLDPGIQSLFIARQFIGAVAIFALGIMARWLGGPRPARLALPAAARAGSASARSWC